MVTSAILISLRLFWNCYLTAVIAARTRCTIATMPACLLVIRYLLPALPQGFLISRYRKELVFFSKIGLLQMSLAFREKGVEGQLPKFTESG